MINQLIYKRLMNVIIILIICSSLIIVFLGIQNFIITKKINDIKKEMIKEIDADTWTDGYWKGYQIATFEIDSLLKIN